MKLVMRSARPSASATTRLALSRLLTRGGESLRDGESLKWLRPGSDRNP